MTEEKRKTPKPVYPHLAFSELTGIVYIVLSKTKKIEVDQRWFRVIAGEWEKYHLTPQKNS